MPPLRKAGVVVSRTIRHEIPEMQQKASAT
jgi:hypothetical protein